MGYYEIVKNRQRAYDVQQHRVAKPNQLFRVRVSEGSQLTEAGERSMEQPT